MFLGHLYAIPLEYHCRVLSEKMCAVVLRGVFQYGNDVIGYDRSLVIVCGDSSYVIANDHLYLRKP
jgi:hypothetical protein